MDGNLAKVITTKIFSGKLKFSAENPYMQFKVILLTWFCIKLARAILSEFERKLFNVIYVCLTKIVRFDRRQNIIYIQKYGTCRNR